ncbi:MAG TPA: hypothetical protein DCP20_00380 [Coriobacteriia bacterium]|nr:MAG: Type III restriction enzyme, res subunit [Actinobacteria bacterium 66_15]HAL29162.1 hypothetical protein [Coriobacteriia bacterium]
MTFLTDELMSGSDWRGFERAVARVMSHCGWSSVRVIGRAGDQGGDILAVRPSGARKISFVVQSKAITGDRYVGKSPIDEAVAAQAAYGAQVGVVATNGDFTHSAKVRRDELRDAGFDMKLWNGAFLRGLLEKWPSEHHERRELRDYQERVVTRCLAAYESGEKRAQFVLATGLGKSVVAAQLLVELRQRGLKRALVLCDRQPLALQLEQSFWTQLPKDVPTRNFFGGAPPHAYDGVNFGLYQSLLGYLGGIDEDEFDVVIVDEAHHALAHGFRTCLTHLKPKFLVGMTATPWLGDGSSIDGLFGEPVDRVSLVDGMSAGYLAKVDYRIFCDNVDWDAVPSLSKNSLTVRDLNRKLFLPQRDEACIAEVARAAAEMEHPRIAVFSPSIEHARRFAQMLTTIAGIRCKCLSGVSRVEQNRALMEFAAGTVEAVTAADVLNEGIDVPDVNILVFLRATHSRRIFVQQLGRGLRVTPEKSRVVVLDFVSDIRRIAVVSELDNELRRQPGPENVYLGTGMVAFSDPQVGPFIDQWLSDVADLSEQNDAHVLEFPEIA